MIPFGRKLMLGAVTMLAIAGPLVIGLLNAPKSFAQSQPVAAAFEVASVKPNKSGERGGSLPMPISGRLTARNVSLKRLMSEAYHIQTFQITGPGRLDSERFDILAKAEGNPTYDQMMPMLQTLLVDRFQLKTHRETKELPLYALVIAKGGPKIRKADGDCPAVLDGKYPCGGFNIRRGGLLTGY